VRSVAFVRGGTGILTGSSDGTTRLWDVATGRPLASLISFRDGSWAVTDPEGRFDASNGGDVGGLHWVVGMEVISLAQLPPLTDPLAERAVGPLRWLAVVAIALYLVAAVRFFLTHRRKPSVMLVALISASALLAEAMATIIWARTWQLSWWLWHLLMAAAFGFVAYSAYTQYQREGGAAGIFDGIVSRETTGAIRREYGSALETLTNTLQRSAQTGVTDQEIDLIIAGLRARFSMTEGQSEVLARAAHSLATERDQGQRLGALAAIGTEADAQTFP
jgi:hypothetical protein